MPQVAVYNTLGEKTGEMSLCETLFAAEVSEPSLHQAVVAYLAAQRQGTHSTLTRAEVRGGGKKPWRQKGTGRARVGSTRSPLWRKGGVTFGPKPRDYRIKMHKNVKRIAMRSAFTSKVLDQDLIILESLDMSAPKTKEMVTLLKNLKVDRKALFITADPEKNVYLSARNLPGISVTFAGSVNVYDILLHDKLIILKDAVGKLEEVFA
ncbi:50S ribosomal protein L4 [bioreactor metagenome]|uniref:50S ribosomal protein L4 n=1 Tax=bioreactor metagenome TaxID=1076179 RepID=A0A644X9B5_9ZZZZ